MRIAKVAGYGFLALLWLGLVGRAFPVHAGGITPPEPSTSLSNDDMNYHVYFPLIFNQPPYTFLVAGHTYGATGVDNPGVHPPFKAWFPWINEHHPRFGFFAGDTVIYGSKQNWDEVDADVASLTFPIHFVVGNHDMTNRALFVSRYGPTYYTFTHQCDLFIVLDSELDGGRITGEQLEFLQTALSHPPARHIFILIHKLIWVADGTPYAVLRDDINGHTGYDFQGSFWEDVMPLLRATNRKVYLIAGDVGVSWAMSLFYQPDGNVRFIATGMGGSEEENFLLFTVVGDKVYIHPQRLDGQPLNHKTITAYNLSLYK